MSRYLGEGTYGTVVKAQYKPNVFTTIDVAVKIMIQPYASPEYSPKDIAINELNNILAVSHCKHMMKGKT